MNTYLANLGKRIEDIRLVLSTGKREFSKMVGLSRQDIKEIEKNPHLLTKETALKIFVIANARAKFETDETVKSLLMISFELNELNTEKFIKKMNSNQTA